MIGNGPGKLENKFSGVARNTRWRFPAWVTNSTVCSIREYGFLFEYVRRCGKRTGDKRLVEEVPGRGRGGGNELKEIKGNCCLVTAWCVILEQIQRRANSVGLRLAFLVC